MNAEKKEAWLEEYGTSFKDILVDEEGREYIMVEPTLMDEGEPEGGKYKKVYISE